MSGITEKILERLKRLEREVERLRVKESPGAWLDWTPAQAGWAALPLGVYRYCRVGKLVIVSVAMVSGQSTNTYASLTLPIKSKNTGVHTYGTSLIVMDSGMQLATPGGWAVLYDSTLLYFWKDCAGTSWTPSGEKLVNGTIIYEAA